MAAKTLDLELTKKQLNKIPLNEPISYKDLTKLLGIKYVAGGNQKIAQMAEFFRYFNYEFTANRRMFIKEIYDKPKPKEYSYPVNTLYSECIEKILMTYLAGRTEDNGTTYISSQYLYLVLGMINNEYIQMQQTDQKEILKDDLRVNYGWLSESEKSIVFYINDFYSRSKSKFHSIIDTSLKSLQRQRLLEYSTAYHMIFEVTDQKGHRIRTNDYYSDDNDTRTILGIEREVLLEMGFKTDWEAITSDKSKDYYEMVLKRAKKKFPDLIGLYRCYKFIYIRKNIQQVLDTEEMTNKKLELNQKVLKFINDQVNKRYLSTVGVEEGFRYTTSYSAAQYYLSNRLIKSRLSPVRQEESTETEEQDDDFLKELEGIL